MDMPISLTIDIDTHEAYMLLRADKLSDSERVHLLERLRKKLPDSPDLDDLDQPAVRDRKLDLDSALTELWASAGRLDGEKWETVQTPEDAYPNHMVSNYGRVVSLPVKRTIELHGKMIDRVYPGRLLSASTTSSGRERVCLRRNGQQKQHFVDHLVWWAFHDHATTDLTHINGDPRDSRLDNLRVE